MAHRLSQSAYLHLYEDEIRRVDPELISFINVNRPADLQRVEGLLKTLDKKGIPAIKRGMGS